MLFIPIKFGGLTANPSVGCVFACSLEIECTDLSIALIDLQLGGILCVNCDAIVVINSSLGGMDILETRT